VVGHQSVVPIAAHVGPKRILVHCRTQRHLSGYVLGLNTQKVGRRDRYKRVCARFAAWRWCDMRPGRCE